MADAVGDVLQSGFGQFQPVVFGVGGAHAGQVFAVLFQQVGQVGLHGIGHGTQGAVDVFVVQGQQVEAGCTDGGEGVFQRGRCRWGGCSLGGLVRWKEVGAGCFFGPLHQVGQDVVALAVGDVHVDAPRRYLAGDAGFGVHAAPSQARLVALDVVVQPVVGADFAQNVRRRVGGRAVVDAVDVAQDDERLYLHHRGYLAGQFVVVGEHQFAERDGVVLVDDGDDAVLQHHPHAVLLRQVVAARGEVFLDREHLSHGDAMLAEELKVAVDELGLSHGGEQLSLVDIVQRAGRTDFALARSDGSRGDENDFDARLVEGGYLVGEGRHAGDVQRPVGACQYVAAYFDSNPSERLFHICGSW